MKTKKIPVNQAVPGMIVAENVYTFSNQLIISEGTKLSDKIITRLKFYSIHQVIVQLQDEMALNPPVNPVNSNLYLGKMRSTEEFEDFSSTVLSTVGRFHNAMDDIANNNGKIDTDSLYRDIKKIMARGRNNLHIFDMLHCMRDYDDMSYIHSINVAIMCHMFGVWLNFGPRDLETLTLCGLLHDIGKLVIPSEILTKKETLTQEEYDLLKSHATRGYKILEQHDINIHIKMTAMMHHERCDGSGYPMGLTSAQIDRFAKIVMIADVYDAMTSSRSYRNPLCPFEVISLFESEGLTKYDPKYIMTLFDHISQLYLNSSVRLSDGRVGQVVFMNRNTLSRPVIQCGEEFVDLIKFSNLYISEIL
ncbi:HD-GYP domain-containing protein [Lachnoclostridium sp.]|uniref:HD-GYP domain-containing protein n=1 Tax=Lachnoclostridium sp. TaxID=2028282 RepID=UPI00289BB247|nr:HD-GYP domain-containing protein [Lachnoclostridium sp.]